MKKIKKLLSIIAGSVPFTPDLRRLKTLLDMVDERTLKTYLKYLEDAGIILTVSRSGRGLRELEKPEKIYLNNPSLINAISTNRPGDFGNLRETFFLSLMSASHKVLSPEHGDFMLNSRYVFEIGGKNKAFFQVKNQENAFLAVDDLETGIGHKTPLWLFGFLY